MPICYNLLDLIQIINDNWVSSVKFFEYNENEYMMCCGASKRIEIFKCDDINSNSKYA